VTFEEQIWIVRVGAQWDLALHANIEVVNHDEKVEGQHCKTTNKLKYTSMQ
jgi:hypothetical protein